MGRQVTKMGCVKLKKLELEKTAGRLVVEFFCTLRLEISKPGCKI